MKHPFTVIASFTLVLVYLLIFQSHDDWRKEVVKSDGRGYYYYLPALFIQQDATYQQTVEAEKQLLKTDYQPYILKTADGKAYNKCYPGVAIMQAPFFLLAYGFETLGGGNPTGYSSVFMFFTLLGSVVYFLLGIFYLKKLIFRISLNERLSWWISILLVFGTNLFFHALEYSTLSHHYTFLLFVLFGLNYLTYLRGFQLKHLIFIGLILGLLFLIRPTNLMIVLFVPLLSGNWIKLKPVFLQLFRFKNAHFILLIGSFFTVASVLLLSNYFQTGKALYWSYQGEGFDFRHPHLVEFWWSYRIGIFVQMPILILGLLGLVYIFKSNRFLFFSWLFAFLTVSYILSSWWCWDFQSFFGNRAFAEYSLLFMWPFIYVWQMVGSRKVIYSLSFLFLGFIGIRTFQFASGINTNQRFTRYTYWKSMFDFNSDTENKYNFTLNAPPFGKEKIWLEKVKGTVVGTYSTEFNGIGEVIHFDLKKDTLRYAYRVSLSKMLVSGDDWKDVYLVFSGQNEKGEPSSYAAQPLYNFYKEAKGTWNEISFEDELYVQRDKIAQLSVYIWNPKGKVLKVKNTRLLIRSYR